MADHYRKTTERDSAVKNTLYKTSVNANWLEDDKAFWYLNVLMDSVTEYLLVDASTGKKTALFDKQGLAELLTRSTGQNVNAKKLFLQRIMVVKAGKQISFEHDKQFYHYTPGKKKLVKIDSFPAVKKPSDFIERPARWESYSTDSVSPDGKWIAYTSNNNVVIKQVTGGDSTLYTLDGTNEKPYGSLAWAPGSNYVIGYRITPVQDSLVYYVLTSGLNSTRGTLRSQPYKQPGDPFTSYEMFVFPVAGKQPVKVNTPIIDFFDAPRLHWSEDKSHFLYEKVDRGHQRFRIIEVDAATGNTKTIFDEQSGSFIYESRIFTSYLPKSNEIIYASERDGWRHIYLLDSKTGIIKNQITKGNFVVKDIDSLDTAKREIWFSANGMNEREDPYYVHYYRICFDGQNLMELTPGMANHSVKYSPGKKYYLDTYSEVNLAPVTVLYETATARKIAEIEQADISRYLKVVKRLPQPFKAKGRDGKTDIWGIFCLPADFDPAKKYPIIENIYAGPQDAFVPKSFIAYYREMQSLADLGFIVVQIDGMGTANRSKAFHDVCWKNLADAGFADRILWMKALSANYPFADTSRVGVYGTSAGGQNALGALLFHPEFYKACVAACGCHDNRVDKQWWNEQWMGYPVGSHYKEQSNVTNAHKLQGDLLLIVGEADENVPPESTYRVADALIKAGKTFDFLPVPGLGHSDGGPYGKIKKRDFFVQHLLDIMPPDRNTNELNPAK